MNKDAFYFPHFSNARHDRKVKRITKELGVEGYGIYFMLLEVLRDQPQMQYPMDDIDLLADEFRTSEQKVRTVICNYKLFDVTTDHRFFSPKLIEYMEPYFKMKEQRRIAGLKSGESRQRKALSQSNDERPLNDRSTTDEQSKGEESKEKKRSVIPPKIEWIKDYCSERKNNIDYNRFYDFYESKGWMVGKGKMKDWEASIRTWEKDSKNSKPVIEEVPAFCRMPDYSGA